MVSTDNIFYTPRWGGGQGDGEGRVGGRRCRWWAWCRQTTYSTRRGGDRVPGSGEGHRGEDARTGAGRLPAAAAAEEGRPAEATRASLDFQLPTSPRPRPQPPPAIPQNPQPQARRGQRGARQVCGARGGPPHAARGAARVPAGGAGGEGGPGLDSRAAGLRAARLSRPSQAQAPARRPRACLPHAAPPSLALPLPARPQVPRKQQATWASDNFINLRWVGVGRALDGPAPGGRARPCYPALEHPASY
jgi:hypothetical protein